MLEVRLMLIKHVRERETVKIPGRLLARSIAG